MIVNNWYVAAESAELGEAPRGVRMLGCDFVLFRDAAGQAACLSAACCHRGGDLARGRCVAGGIQCPYHGWQFDGAGRCTAMPPLGPEARIPRQARVDSYPCVERYGYVWVFLGDQPEAERPGLPDFLPEYADTATWRVTRLRREWHCNWARLHENLLDTSHLYIVHAFGRHLPAQMRIWPVERTEWGGRVVQRFSARPTAASRTAVNRIEAARTRTESTVTLEFTILGLTHRNTQQMSNGYDQIIWNCLTPVDAGRTRSFGLHFRNFQREPEHDEAMLRTISQGLDEDAAIVEHLHPPLMPADSGGELWMATDAMERCYRDQATAIGQRLGVVNAAALASARRDRVLVIPSPGRRAEPKGWVHDTVPLVGVGAPA